MRSKRQTPSHSLCRGQLNAKRFHTKIWLRRLQGNRGLVPDEITWSFSWRIKPFHFALVSDLNPTNADIQTKTSGFMKSYLTVGFFLVVGVVGFQLNQYLESRPIDIVNSGEVARVDPNDPALNAPKEDFVFGEDSLPESKQKVDMTAKPQAVYTYDCSDLVQTPKSMEIMCDEEGDDYIADLVWTSWSVKGATANGSFYKSSCELRCDESMAEYVRYPMTLKLKDPVQEGKIIYFTNAEVSYKPQGEGTSTEIIFDPSFLHKISMGFNR